MTQEALKVRSLVDQRFDVTAFFKRVGALDRGYVELIDGMVTDPCLKIVNAARVSFRKESTSLSDRDSRLIRYLIEHKHFSTFRHSYFSFRIKAPLFVFRQLWKHQVGCDWTEDDGFTGVGDVILPSTSWNEVSGRYVELEPEFYFPAVVRRQSSDNKQGSDGVLDVTLHDQVVGQMSPPEYVRAACLEAYRRYRVLIDAGAAREQARLIIPTNVYSECMLTLSLQAIMYIVELRDKPDAQWETQQYGRGFRELMSPLLGGVCLV